MPESDVFERVRGLIVHEEPIRAFALFLAIIKKDHEHLARSIWGCSLFDFFVSEVEALTQEEQDNLHPSIEAKDIEFFMGLKQYRERIPTTPPELPPPSEADFGSFVPYEDLP